MSILRSTIRGAPLMGLVLAIAIVLAFTGIMGSPPVSALAEYSGPTPASQLGIGSTIADRIVVYNESSVHDFIGATLQRAYQQDQQFRPAVGTFNGKPAAFNDHTMKRVNASAIGSLNLYSAKARQAILVARASTGFHLRQ